MLRNAWKPWGSVHLDWLVPCCRGRVKTAFRVRPIRAYVTRGASGSDKPEFDLPSSRDDTSEENRKSRTFKSPNGVSQEDMGNEYSIDSLLETIRRRKSGEKEEDIVMSRRTGAKTRSYAMDIEELVQFLREENALDLCVIRLSPEMSYVGYFVTCSGTSTRHIRRIADNLVSEVSGI